MTRLERIATLSFDTAWDVDGSLSRDDRMAAAWHEGPVASIAVSRDASIVCSAGADGVVRAWNVAGRELLWQFETHARHLLLSPDGRLAYAVNDALEVWPLDLSTGDALDRAWAPPRRGSRAHRPERTVLSPDGRWLMPSCGDASGAAMLVDLATGASRTLTAPGAGETHPVGRFSDDGRSVWTLGGVRDGRSGRARSALYRFSLATGECEEIRALRLLSQGAQGATPLHRQHCVFSERWLVIAAGREMVRWELTNVTAATWLDARVEGASRAITGDRVFACAIASDRAVAIGSHAKETITAVSTLTSPELVTALTLSPDERWLAVGLASGRVARVKTDVT